MYDIRNFQKKNDWWNTADSLSFQSKGIQLLSSILLKPKITSTLNKSLFIYKLELLRLILYFKKISIFRNSVFTPFLSSLSPSSSSSFSPCWLFFIIKFHLNILFYCDARLVSSFLKVTEATTFHTDFAFEYFH